MEQALKSKFGEVLCANRKIILYAVAPYTSSGENYVHSDGAAEIMICADSPKQVFIEVLTHEFGEVFARFNHLYYEPNCPSYSLENMDLDVLIMPHPSWTIFHQEQASLLMRLGRLYAAYIQTSARITLKRAKIIKAKGRR